MKCGKNQIERAGVSNREEIIYDKVIPVHAKLESAMTAAATRPVAIKIDQDTRDRVKRLAEARHRTSHWVMREAINQYVEREEKREAFGQDAINSWNEYRETGLHVTDEEVVAWLDTWGEENEKAAPICHK